MKRFRLVELLALILLGACCSQQAQAQRWINYTLAEGLPSLDLTAVAEDDHNGIWIGTLASGLSRFDGREWTSASQALGYALSSDLITCLLKDQDGDLWIGTYNRGFSRINPERELKDPATWLNHNVESTHGGLLHNQINALFEDEAGNIWFGTRGGVSIAAAQAVVQNELLSRRENWDIILTPGVVVNAMAKDTLGNIWVGTNSGAYRYNPKKRKESGVWAHDFAHNVGIVQALFCDHMGNIWIGRYGSARNSVMRFPTMNPELLDSFDVAKNVFAIAEDHDRKVWFGALGEGVFVIDPASDLHQQNNWKQFQEARDGLASNQSNDFMRGSEGDLWVTTDGGGLSRLDYSWRNFAQTVDFCKKNVLTIAEDDSGYLWFGANGDGIHLVPRAANLFIADNWENIRSREKTLATDQINVIFEDSNRRFWIGGTADNRNYQALNSVNPYTRNDWLFFSSSDSILPGNNVYAIVEDAQRFLWFGTNRGLCRVPLDSADSRENFREAMRVYTTADGLKSSEITSLLTDHSSRLWVGTAQGLNWITLPIAANARWQSLDAITGTVQTIFEDSSGGLWLGTVADGVYQIPANGEVQRSRHFTKANGLPSNNVRAIVQVRAQEYWFTTSSGLSRLRVHGSDSLWTTFEKSEAGDLSLFAAFEDRRGDLWFGTANNGVTRHRLKLDAPDTRMVSKFDAVTTDNVILQFAGVDRSTLPQKFRYSYRFDGSRWSPFLPNDILPIFGLREGRHVFEVRASDSDGDIDSTPATEVFYKINPSLGGKSSFMDSVARVTLYFPPGELLAPNEVTITPVARYEAADSSTIVAYDIAPLSQHFQKPLTLNIALRSPLTYAREQIAIFRQDSSQWLGVGGTVEDIAGAPSVTTAITKLGRYALRSSKVPARTHGIDSVNIQPRIFSPAGGGQGYGDHATISFLLRKDDNVSVKIYNAAGRLKRRLRDNTALFAGFNAIEWDGRDEDGKVCVSGIYIAIIQGQEQAKTKTVVLSNRFE